MFIWIKEILSKWGSWFWENIPNFSAAINIATWLTGSLLVGGPIAAILRFRSTHKIDEHINMQDKYKQIKQNLRYYIPTRIQMEDPVKNDGYNTNSPSSDAVSFFIDDIFKNSRDKYHLILADSGMGKTTFLERMFVTYYKKPFRRYDITIVSLVHKNSIRKIKDIKDKENTILLLDAYDEDVYAREDYEKRLDAIYDATESFYKVVMTCRTQFFPNSESEPKFTGRAKPGTGDKAEIFQKYYISPFNNKEVDQYLRKKYNFIFEKNKIECAKKIIDKCPNLMARPLILSYVDDLISDENKEYNYRYKVYREVIDKWIKRESIKNEYENLYRLSERVALYQYNEGKNIDGNEIEKLCNQYDIDLEPVIARSKSLLNRNAMGEYKFAHQTILEYFLAKKAFEDLEFRKDITLGKFSGYDVCQSFLYEMCTEYIYAQFISKEVDGRLVKLLQNMSFEFFQLVNATLGGVVIENCNFKRSSMMRINLKSAYISHTDLCETNLLYARLQHANIMDVELVKANLVKADLSGARLRKVNLSGADLREANLVGVSLVEVNLSKANLSELDLGRKELSGVNLTEANLTEANLTKLDFSGAELTGANLTGANLSGTNLQDANLHRACMKGAKLVNANLSEANLNEVNLLGANLQKAILSRLDLTKVSFEGADLMEAYFVRTTLTGADLLRANLIEAYLVEANLQDANLQEACMQRAEIERAKLQRANLIEADLTEANLTEADLTGADLTGADLTGANLAGADLTGANLIGATLERANLIGATLAGTNLVEANLIGATLAKVDLKGINLTEQDLIKVNLTRANLNGVNLKKAKLKRAKLMKLDLTKTNLEGADLTRANLIGANLSGADLTKVILEGADLREADLTGATLTEAVLNEADLRGAKMKKIKLRDVIITNAKLDQWQDVYINKACDTYKIPKQT